jgi:putative FmdB family regulatory protein
VPTYQYACTDCGDRSEAVQKFTDDPLTVCTVCGGKLRKVYSAVGIVFKGSGFYRTDSRSAAMVTAENGAKDGKDSGKDSKDSKDKSKSGSADAAASSGSSAGNGASKSDSASSSSSSSSSGSGSSGDKKAATTGSSGSKVA